MPAGSAIGRGGASRVAPSTVSALGQAKALPRLDQVANQDWFLRGILGLLVDEGSDRHGEVQIGPRYSVTNSFDPVRARDPGEFTGGIWNYLYPPRPSVPPPP